LYSPSIRPGYSVSSLLSNGFQGNTGPTKPCPAPPELYKSLTGTISTRLGCNKAQHAYLRDRHLSSYADVVAWTGTSWRWQLLELIPHLSDALRSLTLPVSELVPLLPGQAWHIADSTQLFLNRLTKILLSLPTAPHGAFGQTSFTDTGSSLIQSYPLRCGQLSPRLLHLSFIMVRLT